MLATLLPFSLVLCQALYLDVGSSNFSEPFPPYLFGSHSTSLPLHNRISNHSGHVFHIFPSNVPKPPQSLKHISISLTFSFLLSSSFLHLSPKIFPRVMLIILISILLYTSTLLNSLYLLHLDLILAVAAASASPSVLIVSQVRRFTNYLNGVILQ